MIYDVIIIGKGPAGISASLYTGRGKLKTLIIGKESVLIKGKVVENYCCTDPASGEELIEKGINQAKSFGAEIVEEEVVDIKNSKDYFTILTDKNQYDGKAIVIATGKERIQVPIKGLKEFEGKGVHYCAACDGFFYTDSKVGILGYKDYAINELREFENITKDVILFTNGKELKINDKNKEYLERNNIKINKKVIKKIEGKDFLEKVVFDDGSDETIQGLFVAYGSASSTDFARKLGVAVEKGNIQVDEEQQTNVSGIFAAGDCTGKLAQVATAVGQGAVAGQKVKSYVQRQS